MRKPLVGAAAVIIIAGLAYTAAWFYGANQLKHAVEHWKQDAAAEGVAISYDEIRTGGYPLSLTAELVNLALRAEGKGVSFQSARSACGQRCGIRITSPTISPEDTGSRSLKACART